MLFETSYRQLASVTCLLCACLVMASCDSAIQEYSNSTPFQPEPEPWVVEANQNPYLLPQINVQKTPGPFGGPAFDVEVLPGGFFSHKSPLGIPRINKQLSDSLYFELARRLRGISPPLGYVAPSCSDSASYLVEVFNDYYHKYYETDCPVLFYEAGLVDSSSINLIDFLTEFERQANYVYESTAPWVGLLGTFEIGQSVYSSTDSLEVRLLLENPTDSIRTLYFTHAERITFSTKYGRDHLDENIADPFCTEINGIEPSCLGNRVSLDPGEKTFLSRKIPVKALGLTIPADHTISIDLTLRALTGYYIFEYQKITVHLTN